MSEAARGDKDDPFTCSKCGGPTKENGRWHPDLGTIYGYELGLGDATCGKRKAHGYEIDAIITASREFRATVAPTQAMSRGEAQHIARYLAAVRSGEES